MPWILTIERPGLPDRNFPVMRPETAKRIITILGFDPNEPTLQVVAVPTKDQLERIMRIIGIGFIDLDVTVILFREV